MKSCLGILLVFFTFVAVLGGGALIWYLSSTSEFSRKVEPAAPTSTPKATPAAPSAPKPAPVR